MTIREDAFPCPEHDSQVVAQVVESHLIRVIGSYQCLTLGGSTTLLSHVVDKSKCDQVVEGHFGNKLVVLTTQKESDVDKQALNMNARYFLALQMFQCHDIMC